MKINLKSLIYPLFVEEGLRKTKETPSLAGVYVYPVGQITKQVKKLKELGLKNFLIFGSPAKKTWEPVAACQKDSVVPRAVSLIKSKVSKVKLITDICLCAYTEHGHCGIIEPGKTGLNREKTLKALSAMALSCAQAGADYVAPSAMCLGQTRAIRKTLDKAGFKKTKILGYSAKFASNFYGPFRDIADSAPGFGNRQAYQLNYRNSQAALARIKTDIKEGADIIMVKPALNYLDIIKEAKARFNKPLAAYNVSGEYFNLKQGAKLGYWNEKEAVQEVIASIKRSGADLVITYHAKDIATWQQAER